jgi:RNA polymerase primary sigma factor
MTLKELVGNAEVKALVARGQEFGFVAIGELTQTLETADLDAPSVSDLASELDEMGIELIEDDEAERRVAELAEEAERPRKLNLRTETTTDSLQLFLKDVGKVPLLTARQEVELAKKIELGDLEAKRKMVEANLRLIVSSPRTTATRASGSST